MSEYRNPNPRAFVSANFIIDMGVVLAAEYDKDDETILIHMAGDTLEFSVTETEFRRFMKEFEQYLTGY